MIPQGRITPGLLRKRAEELAKLFGEFAVMTDRVQPNEVAVGQQYIDPPGSYTDRSRAKQDWYRDSPTMPLHQVSTARTAPGEKKSDLDVVREAIEDIQGQLAGVRKQLTEGDEAQQLQAVSRGMANAVRRIRALEEENRLLREAQLATVQDVLALQESVRHLQYGTGESQQVNG